MGFITGIQCDGCGLEMFFGLNRTEVADYGQSAKRRVEYREVASLP